MKKMCALMAVLMAILVAGIWATGSNAYSYDDIRVERVASYNAEFASKVVFEKNYVMICESLNKGSVEVGVSNVTYSADGSEMIVHLYNKNAEQDYSTESNYVTYWNIYVPINDSIKTVNVQWD